MNKIISGLPSKADDTPLPLGIVTGFIPSKPVVKKPKTEIPIKGKFYWNPSSVTITKDAEDAVTEKLANGSYMYDYQEDFMRKMMGLSIGPRIHSLSYHCFSSHRHALIVTERLGRSVEMFIKRDMKRWLIENISTPYTLERDAVIFANGHDALLCYMHFA